MFMAYINETDNGCDYTVACGKVLRQLVSSTADDALAEIREMMGEGLPSDLVSIILLDVREITAVPLSAWCAEEREVAAARAVEWLEEEEREEYERLKRKYR